MAESLHCYQAWTSPSTAQERVIPETPPKHWPRVIYDSLPSPSGSPAQLGLFARRPSLTAFLSNDKLNKSTALEVAPLVNAKIQPLLRSLRTIFSSFFFLLWSEACRRTPGSLFAHVAHWQHSSLECSCAKFLYTFTYKFLTGDRTL